MPCAASILGPTCRLGLYRQSLSGLTRRVVIVVTGGGVCWALGVVSREGGGGTAGGVFEEAESRENGRALPAEADTRRVA